MGESTISGMRERLGQVFLALVLAVVMVSVLLPSATIGWMRHQWLWFTLPLDWIERQGSAVSLVHAILFLLLGMAMRLALRHWSPVRVAVALLALGILTELAQLFVPGRSARIEDVIVDFVAGVAGWALVRVVAR